MRESHREHRRRARYLLILADLTDGRRVFKMVDIPDPEITMEIAVELP
jgi:hypothetical protein